MSIPAWKRGVCAKLYFSEEAFLCWTTSKKGVYINRKCQDFILNVPQWNLDDVYVSYKPQKIAHTTLKWPWPQGHFAYTSLLHAGSHMWSSMQYGRSYKLKTNLVWLCEWLNILLYTRRGPFCHALTNTFSTFCVLSIRPYGMLEVTCDPSCIKGVYTNYRHFCLI